MKKFSVLAAILLVATVVLTSVGCAGPGVVSSWKNSDEQKFGDAKVITTLELFFYTDGTFKERQEIKVEGTVPEQFKSEVEEAQKFFPMETTGTYEGDAGKDGGVVVTINKITVNGRDYDEVYKEVWGFEPPPYSGPYAYTIAGNELKEFGSVVAKKQ